MCIYFTYASLRLDKWLAYCETVTTKTATQNE